MFVPISLLVMVVITLLLGIRTNRMLRRMDEQRKSHPPEEDTPPEEPGPRKATVDTCWPPVQTDSSDEEKGGET